MYICIKKKREKSALFKKYAILRVEKGKWVNQKCKFEFSELFCIDTGKRRIPADSPPSCRGRGTGFAGGRIVFQNNY